MNDSPAATAAADARVVLLGPQRRAPTVSAVVQQLVADPQAPVATITAGWEEREAEQDELAEHLAREVVNLEVYARCEDIYARDPELHEAMRARHDRLRELREIYRLRLASAAGVARSLLRRAGDEGLLGRERGSAIHALRTLDTEYEAHVREILATFEQHWRPAEREHVARHREQVGILIDRCAAVCVAGGHVAIMHNRMRLLGVDRLLPARPVIAWSAGAMTLSDDIVLFHDFPPQGKGNVEVFEPGFGLAPGLVALPHASRRLILDDPHRVELLARRFAPALCVALDDNARADWDGRNWTLHPGTRCLTTGGALTDAGAA